MEPSSFLFLLILLVLISASVLFQHYRSKLIVSPGLKTYPLLGHLPHFFKNRHRFLEWITQVLSDSPTHTISFLIEPISSNGIFTANPSNVEHILKTNFHNYPKGKETIATLHDFLGYGIFNSDGQQWLWQRKVASFEFNTKSLRSFIHEIVQNEIVSRFLPVLLMAVETGEVIDLQEEFKRFGFNNIFRVCFGDNAGGGECDQLLPPAEFSVAFQEAQNLIMARFMNPLEWVWRLKKLFNVGSEKCLRKVIPIVHSYTESLIRIRKPDGIEGPCKNDLMSRISAEKIDMKENQLRDMLINFIVAGQETTSSALTWLFWILSSRRDVEKHILDEIRAVRKNKSKDEIGFSYEELRGMQYLHAAISESMRLYPPVPIEMLSSLEDDILPNGTSVGKGWFVSYSAYAMGRLQDLWGKDCMEYRPERWLDDKGGFRQESSFRYTVFNGGPRACLGKDMAYLQMKLIVVAVLEKFEIVAVGKEKEVKEYVPSFTLKMKGGLLVCVQNRDRY